MRAITKILARTPYCANHDSFLGELEAAGYAVVPLHPTAEMIEEGMRPARHGSIGDVYREMVAVGRVKA